MATHPKQVVFGAIGFAVLCVAAVFLVLYLRSYESTDDAQVDGHLNAVSTRVMGTVEHVYVEDSQIVSAGQMLVELDPRDFNNALEQAKASYASAEAQLKAENPNVPIVRTSNESTDRHQSGRRVQRTSRYYRHGAGISKPAGYVAAG